MKKIKMIFSLYFLFLSFAWASTDVSVKVISYPCDNPYNELVGSGALLKMKGSLFVLTSDHVIYPQSQSSCYEIMYQEQKYKASFSRRDISYGLGLLKLEVDLENFLTLDDFLKTNELSGKEKVRVTSFPAASSNPIHSVGLIQTSHSMRHKIASIKSTIEFSGLNVEFGMSGGPIFDLGSGKFLAMASHQIITFNEGQPSKVSTISSGSGYANAIFGIKSDDIISWLQEEKPAVFKEKMSDALSDDKSGASIYVKDLEFQLGKSGGDGAGVGGKPLHSDLINSKEENLVTLSFQNEFVNELEAPYPHLKFTWVKINKQLRLGRKIQIRSFVKLSHLTNISLRVYKFKTQADFLKLLANKDYLPLIEHIDANSSIKPKDKALLKKLLALQDINEPLKKLIFEIESIFDIAVGENPEILQTINIDHLLDIDHLGWARLIDIDADLAVETLRFLRNVKKRL